MTRRPESAGEGAPLMTKRFESGSVGAPRMSRCPESAPARRPVGALMHRRPDSTRWAP